MSAEPPRKSRYWRRFVIVLVGLAALDAGYRLTVHLMVRAKLNSIRRQGYPATRADLDKWYPQPPPGENAADVYLEAFRLFAPEEKSNTPGLRRFAGEETLNESNRPPCSSVVHFTQELSAKEVATVASNMEALLLLHKAALMTRCRYPINFIELTPNTLLPHLSQVRKGSRLLATEARSYDSTDHLKSVEALDAAIALGQSLASEPLMISQLVRLNCHSRAIAALERVLSNTSFSDDALVRLTSSFSTIEGARNYLRGLAGELCSISAQIQHLTPPFLSVWDVTALQDRWLLAYLDGTGQLFDAARGDYPASLSAVAALTAKWDDPSNNEVVIGLGFHLGDPLTKEAGVVAYARCATTALAIERYRLARNSLPQTLDELVPSRIRAIPADPFDGQPLRYKKLATGYAVYSICKDGRDDGGDEKNDITFTVER